MRDTSDEAPKKEQPEEHIEQFNPALKRKYSLKQILIFTSVFAIIGVATLLLTKAATTNTYYASTSGSGTTCSSTSPCDFLTGVDTVFANGGTLIAKDGSYTFNNYLYGVNNSTSNAVILRSESKYGAKLIFTANGSFATYFYGGFKS